MAVPANLNENSYILEKREHFSDERVSIYVHFCNTKAANVRKFAFNIFLLFDLHFYLFNPSM